MIDGVGLRLDRNILIIGGPTGVGKSDLACMIAQQVPAEIVNADMGQLYTPFSIGTAKPNWKTEAAPHHLFDVISEPVNCTVVQYRQMLSAILEEIWSRGRLPIIVGGSGFYVQSIFFPPAAGQAETSVSGTWQDLQAIDPVRASHIHPHDVYRISRALSIYASGIKPSACVRNFDPVSNHAHIVWVTRERAQLHERINERVVAMIGQGWLDECKMLAGTPWQEFLYRKKLIGYPEMFECLAGSLNNESAIAQIAQKTRAYAKRQETFWRMLKRSLVNAAPPGSLSIEELNLTLYDPCLYINQLLQRLAGLQ